MRRWYILALLLGGLMLLAAPVRAQPPAKQWVWLHQVKAWGYGYMQADGQWVIDEGSQRRPGEQLDHPAAVTDGNTTIPTPPAAQPAAAAAQPAPPVAAVTADPYGFVAILNWYRSMSGLPAVGYDPNLAAWAQQNNMQQQVSGLGHFVMGPARRQNAAMGQQSAAQVAADWMTSPGHRSAMLDPTIRWVGIAALGAAWTMSAY